jgi:hypothetical protein
MSRNRAHRTENQYTLRPPHTLSYKPAFNVCTCQVRLKKDNLDMWVAVMPGSFYWLRRPATVHTRAMARSTEPIGRSYFYFPSTGRWPYSSSGQNKTISPRPAPPLPQDFRRHSLHLSAHSHRPRWQHRYEKPSLDRRPGSLCAYILQGPAAVLGSCRRLGRSGRSPKKDGPGWWTGVEADRCGPCQ